MIKYYCDICKKEITEGKVRMAVRCSLIPKMGHDMEMWLHNDCAIDFIGREKIEEMTAAEAERKKVQEARKAERMKKEREQNG